MHILKKKKEKHVSYEVSLIFPIWAPTLAIRWWCQLASIGYRWVAQPPTRCTIMNYELYHMHACASWPARLPNGQTNIRPYRSPSEVDWEVSCRMDTISFMVIIYLHSINSGFTAPIGWFKLRGHLSYIHILTGEHHFPGGQPPLIFIKEDLSIQSSQGGENTHIILWKISANPF